MKLRTLMPALIGTLLLLGASAEAAPVKMGSRLQSEILRARQVDPGAFVTVSAIVSQAPIAHEKARGRKAPVAQQLARLGPAATLPMLEKLGAETPALVRRDLIEAVGLLADARGVPVLAAILADASEDAETTRTTAEALARIGTDEAANHVLSALSGAAPERARAILGGMGELRKLRVTEAIAARVRAGDDATVRVAARSLGRAGNAWAWKAIAGAHGDTREEQQIRETAAKALVEAFVAHEGEARAAASNALMVVDAPATPGLIAQARAAANPATQAALDALAARFAGNPTR